LRQLLTLSSTLGDPTICLSAFLITAMRAVALSHSVTYIKDQSVLSIISSSAPHSVHYLRLPVNNTNCSSDLGPVDFFVCELFVPPPLQFAKHSQIRVLKLWENILVCISGLLLSCLKPGLFACPFIRILTARRPLCHLHFVTTRYQLLWSKDIALRLLLRRLDFDNLFDSYVTVAWNVYAILLTL
jgi:hypothetical protein